MKPVVLAVDDDPAAIHRIGEELRRRYGHDYDVICDQSAPEALGRLEALHDADRAVAVVLADQWMPGLSGTDLLTRVKELYPRAKRGLLIEFGDWGDQPTAAAIRRAMALGIIDYYVLKPWRSPDELFHRTVSEFLQEWSRADPHVSREVVVVGEANARRSHELCSLLARNGVPYAFYACDSEHGRGRVEAAGLTAGDAPAVFLLDGRVLVDPSNAELARGYGVTTELEGSRDFDVVIVGAGPSGLSAAVYASSEGFDALVIERESIGGQAGASSKIRNYLGFSRGVSGDELAQRAYQQAWVFGTDFLLMREVTGLRTEHDRHVLTTSDGAEINARAVILANGVTYQRLGIPTLENLIHAGVYYGASRSEMAAFAGEHVFVVGGANSAGQAALHLARSARQVSIVVRGPNLAASMSQYLLEEIAAASNIDVRLNTNVIDGGGEQQLEFTTLRDSATGATSTEQAGGLFVFIGAYPHTAWLPEAFARDERGYVLTGTDLLESEGAARWPLTRTPYMFESSVPGVFAVGDVRSGSIKRVASAVGEGSVAIQQIGLYLASDPAAQRTVAR